MEELNPTVKKNAENVKQANQLTTNVSDFAAKSSKVMGDVVDTMASISTSSRKIADIISVIDNIALEAMQEQVCVLMEAEIVFKLEASRNTLVSVAGFDVKLHLASVPSFSWLQVYLSLLGENTSRKNKKFRKLQLEGGCERKFGKFFRSHFHEAPVVARVPIILRGCYLKAGRHFNE